MVVFCELCLFNDNIHKTKITNILPVRPSSCLSPGIFMVFLIEIVYYFKLWCYYFPSLFWWNAIVFDNNSKLIVNIATTRHLKKTLWFMSSSCVVCWCNMHRNMTWPVLTDYSWCVYLEKSVDEHSSRTWLPNNREVLSAISTLCLMFSSLWHGEWETTSSPITEAFYVAPDINPFWWSPFKTLKLKLSSWQHLSVIYQETLFLKMDYNGIMISGCVAVFVQEMCNDY